MFKIMLKSTYDDIVGESLHRSVKIRQLKKETGELNDKFEHNLGIQRKLEAMNKKMEERHQEELKKKDEQVQKLIAGLRDCLAESNEER